MMEDNVPPPLTKNAAEETNYVIRTLQMVILLYADADDPSPEYEVRLRCAR
jgi:hypothetical protein